MSQPYSFGIGVTRGAGIIDVDDIIEAGRLERTYLCGTYIGSCFGYIERGQIDGLAFTPVVD